MTELVATADWTLTDALGLVRDIQPKLHERKWHVALGGGVLNRGVSSKDVDLYFLPFGDITTTAIVPLLTEWWGASEPFRANADLYPPDINFVTKVKFFLPCGRRIDAFVAKHAEMAL